MIGVGVSLHQFESNVILDRYKTYYWKYTTKSMFESNVILDRYKTFSSWKLSHYIV